MCDYRRGLQRAPHGLSLQVSGGRQSESMCTVWLADQAAVVANHCSGQPAKIRSKT